MPGAEIERAIESLPEGEPLAGTALFEPLQLFDFYGDAPVEVAKALIPNERPPKEVFYPPALALLVLLVFMQRRRVRRAQSS